MNKLKNVCLMFWLFFALASSVTFGYDYVENELDDCYKEAVYNDIEAESNGNYYVYRFQVFDEEDGRFTWDPGYLYVLAGDGDHSKVFIYKTEGNSVVKIWESIEIPARAIETRSIDLDDKGKCEHLLFTIKQDENGTRWYQIWAFSWEGTNSRLIYPKNLEDNKLTSMKEYINLDYDRDWTYEFIVLEKQDEKYRYYKYYAFNKNNLDELLVEKEEIDPIKKPQPQTQTKELTFEEKNPEIVKFIYEKHGNIKIYGIYDLWYTFRHMVLTDIGKIIVDKRNDNVTEVCVLDSSFDKYAFIPHMAKALDIDNDSMPEIPFYSFDDVENMKLYFYFVSVQPGKSSLLSPLDENGRSRIWTMGDPVYYERAKDGNLVVIAYKCTKDGNYEDSYWKWDPKAQKLIEVLDF